MGESIDDGQRDCARGPHCAARETVVEDGRRTVRPARTYRVFCDADRDRIAACLTELPRFYTRLGDRIGDKTRSAGPRVSGGARTSPVPLNLAVEAFMGQIAEVVFSWEERVRHLANLTEVHRGRGGQASITTACTVLNGHVDALLALPTDAMTRTMDIAHAEHLPQDAVGLVHPYAGWIEYAADLGGEEAGREVLNLHHRSLKLLGLTPAHHDLVVACWECDERTLRRHDGTAGLADHVECTNPGCREQYLGYRLQALMVDEEAAQRRKHDRESRRAEGHASVLHGSREGYGGRR